MQYRPFGSKGQQVSVIGMGTWYIDLADRDTAVRALQAGLDHGMNHIDTAEMYGDAELVIRDAIRERRDEALLVSKVLPHNASRQGTRRACERSLLRLGTDRLDCYLLHWRGPFPLEETIAGFQDLEPRAKSYPGVSATSTPMISRRLTASQDQRAKISPAIRFFITWSSGLLNMRCFPGVSVTVWR